MNLSSHCDVYFNVIEKINLLVLLEVAYLWCIL